MTGRDAIEAYIGAGISAIPTRTDGTKAPAPCVGSWKTFQSRPATPHELARWRAAGLWGVAIIMGLVSGNLECVDFDDPDLFRCWCDHIRAVAPGLLERLVIVRTPSGCYHIYYRAPAVSGNEKRAMRPETPAEVAARIETLVARGVAVSEHHRKPRAVTLIETRGEGGYAMTYPSPGYELLQGAITTPPLLTTEERTLLHDGARMLDQMPVTPLPELAHHPDQSSCSTGERRPARPRVAGDLLPGDDYNARGEALAVLLKHGWSIERTSGGVTYLRRPGKEAGVSATWGYHAGYLVVFSTNAPPFAATCASRPTGYDAFAVYALLEHGGDFHAAARALRAQGFGHPRIPLGQRPLQGGAFSETAVRSILAPRTFSASEVSQWLR